MKKVFLLLTIIFIGCVKEQSPYTLETFTEKGNLNFYVEIPAGTNKKFEYNEKEDKLIINKIGDKDRVIQFLPYPGNYGFIPSTKLDKDNGGDGDALDAILLSEYIKKESIVEVKPIGVLKLIDNNEKDYKIICIPIDVKKRIFKADNFKELAKKYPKALKILELWFLNYDDDTLSFENNNAWGDEKEALKIINESK